MLSIGRRIKNLFGFRRPKSAVTVAGPTKPYESLRSKIDREKRSYRREYIPMGVPMPSESYIPIYVPVEHHHFDPTPAPIQPETFVGGGGEGGGGGASGGWDSSSSYDSGSSSGGDSGGSSGGGGGE